MSVSSLRAVSMMIGRRSSRARSARHTASPSMSGSVRSRSTRSMLALGASSAASPFMTCWTTKPSRSRARSSGCAIARSSSTSSIDVIGRERMAQARLFALPHLTRFLPIARRIDTPLPVPSGRDPGRCVGHRPAVLRRARPADGRRVRNHVVAREAPLDPRADSRSGRRADGCDHGRGDQRPLCVPPDL